MRNSSSCFWYLLRYILAQSHKDAQKKALATIQKWNFICITLSHSQLADIFRFGSCKWFRFVILAWAPLPLFFGCACILFGSYKTLIPFYNHSSDSICSWCDCIVLCSVWKRNLITGWSEIKLIAFIPAKKLHSQRHTLCGCESIEPASSICSENFCGVCFFGAIWLDILKMQERFALLTRRKKFRWLPVHNMIRMRAEENKVRKKKKTERKKSIEAHWENENNRISGFICIRIFFLKIVVSLPL